MTLFMIINMLVNTTGVNKDSWKETVAEFKLNQPVVALDSLKVESHFRGDVFGKASGCGTTLHPTSILTSVNFNNNINFLVTLRECLFKRKVNADVEYVYETQKTIQIKQPFHQTSLRRSIPYSESTQMERFWDFDDIAICFRASLLTILQVSRNTHIQLRCHTSFAIRTSLIGSSFLTMLKASPNVWQQTPPPKAASWGIIQRPNPTYSNKYRYKGGMRLLIWFYHNTINTTKMKRYLFAQKYWSADGVLRHDWVV